MEKFYNFGSYATGVTTEDYSRLIEMQREDSARENFQYVVHGTLTNGSIYFQSGKVILSQRNNYPKEKLSQKNNSGRKLGGLEIKSSLQNKPFAILKHKVKSKIWSKRRENSTYRKFK